jgi:4,5-epoxidase
MIVGNTSGVDVIVVGAGPTGLVVACDLVAAGVSVRVIDKAERPSVTSRALGLQPRGVEVVDRAGALGVLPERAIGLLRISLHLNGKLAAVLRTDSRTKPGLVISQAEIEGALRQRLAELGGSVEWGVGLDAVSQDGDRVTARLSDGSSANAGWLVGCDGAHSSVRKAVGIGFPGVPLGERFLLADVRADLPFPRDGVSVWLRGEEVVTAFPLPGSDLWRLMGPAPADVPEHPSHDDVLRTMTELLREHAGVADLAVREAEWTSVFRFHRRLADTYRVGRVLIAGDAAHIHSPLGGQGLNTGVGDGENLAWKLALVALGRADAELLDTYQAERRPIASDVLKSTTGATRIGFADTPVARWMRDHVFLPLLNRPFVQRYLTEQSSQLKVHYRGGPLAPRTFRPGLRPGERVPDRPCLRADGSPTRLHAELGPRWVLLGAGESDECAVLARKRLGDDLVTVLRPGGRDLMLIRPDAHLAWRGAPEPDGLDRWLTGMLGR